ncbi:M56 family metallopeptidase [Bacillus chungangensis]|uniref:Beta-lactamase regulating signal transducer with metallopeptidase domain n=1 Tax=Bacillus chungangensis TaxID=587633 RepID=A0ABT9WWU9_9BACI|nr:M56 family metallopeptidase [Bacillus chungangensis]MDQ0177775.1 beta-lactamase regulating signal transducer with metallopeptidase domain [Bacillus chungangensis]
MAIQLLFLKVMELSIAASVIVLIILLLRRIGGKWLHPWMIYCLWLIVLIKLILPFHIPSTFSIENMTDRYFYQKQYSIGPVLNSAVNAINNIYDGKSEIKKAVRVYKDGALTIDTATIKDPSVVEQYKFGTTMNGILTGCGILWLIGFIIFTTKNIYRNRKFKKLFVNGNVCENEEIIHIFDHCKKELGIKRKIDLMMSGSVIPVIHGILKPCILLPFDCKKNFKTEELRYILLHELQHYKQKDTIVFFIGDMLKAIHWFNPLIQFGMRKMQDDSEVLCDFQVMRLLKKNECIDYGMLLLRQAELNISQFSKSSMSANWFGGHSQLVLRIRKIGIYYQLKPKKIHRIYGTCLLLLMSVTLLTANYIYAEQKAYIEAEPILYAFWLNDHVDPFNRQAINSIAEQMAGLSSVDKDVVLLMTDKKALANTESRTTLLFEQTWPFSIYYSQRPIEVSVKDIREEVQRRELKKGNICIFLKYHFAFTKHFSMSGGRNIILDLKSLERLDNVNLY